MVLMCMDVRGSGACVCVLVRVCVGEEGASARARVSTCGACRCTWRARATIGRACVRGYTRTVRACAFMSIAPPQPHQLATASVPDT
eukprot:15448466-Alexandrium_andersonii.AAC.1